MKLKIEATGKLVSGKRVHNYWFISTENILYYLHSDLTIKFGTNNTGRFRTREEARKTLREFRKTENSKLTLNEYLGSFLVYTAL